MQCYAGTSHSKIVGLDEWEVHPDWYEPAMAINDTREQAIMCRMAKKLQHARNKRVMELSPGNAMPFRSSQIGPSNLAGSGSVMRSRKGSASPIL